MTIPSVLLVTIGAGIVALAAGFGIAKLGISATESIARQPEAAGDITKAMIIAAAMIEGVALFCALVCFLALNK